MLLKCCNNLDQKFGKTLNLTFKLLVTSFWRISNLYMYNMTE